MVLCHVVDSSSLSFRRGVSSITLPILSTRVTVSPKSLNQKLTYVKAKNELGSIKVLPGITKDFQVALGTIDHPLISIVSSEVL